MIYLAAPFFKPNQVDTVKRIEHLLESFRLPYYSPRKEGVLLAMSPEDRKRNARTIFDSNVEWIDRCARMIAVIDDRDPGVMWEIGFAYAKAKTIITFTDHAYGVNVMIQECVAAHCKGIERLKECLTSSDVRAFRDFEEGLVT